MVESGLWPLYEITEGNNFTLSYKPNELKPFTETLRIQRRYRHLTDDESLEIQTKVNDNWQQLLNNDGKRLPF